MASISDRLIFAWWNTGLSPVGRQRAPEKDFAFAAKIVGILLRDLRVDCLGLAEVTKTDLDCLRSESALSEYCVYDGTLKEGRVQFDTGAIFNASRLTQVHQAAIIVEYATGRFKLANRIDFTTRGDNQPFHVFLSHWPSHITPDSEFSRIMLAARLQERLREIMRCYNGNARLIVMGDFNEEPFHESLQNQLLATRDRMFVMRSPNMMLYNPFWRHLGESEPYAHDMLRKSFAGTCFVRSGRVTKWKTVDQIILSAAFLGRSPWHLNESLTQILPITPQAVGEGATVGVFDHFPVIVVIEKVQED